MKKFKYILLFLNFTVLIVLIYFVVTNFYTWKGESAWLNPTFYFYTKRTDVKILTIICIIVPILIFLIQKKYYYFIIQSILIFVIAINYNKDFFQKTIFINQPTSIQKTNNEIKKFIENNETSINEIINEIEKRNFDSINKFEINKFSEKHSFKIHHIILKDTKIKSMTIVPKAIVQSYHSFYLEYFPNNFNTKSDEIYKFGTKISLLRSRVYFYGKKWLIYVSGNIAEG